MTHLEAQATAAVDRYLLDEMDETERSHFEEHYFSCAECAEEVRISFVFADNMKAVLAETKAPASNVTTMPVRAGRSPWITRVLQIAATAVFGIFSFQNLYQIPQLRQAVAESNAPRVAEPVFISESRSELPAVEIAHNQKSFALNFSLIEAKRFAFYTVQFTKAGGEVVWTKTFDMSGFKDEWQLTAPTAGLTEGQYIVKVSGSPSTTVAPVPVSDYHLQVKFR